MNKLSEGLNLKADKTPQHLLTELVIYIRMMQ